jgi:hypothetical protein
MKFLTILPFLTLFAASSIAAPVAEAADSVVVVTPEQRKALEALAVAKILPDSYDDNLPPYSG